MPKNPVLQALETYKRWGFSIIPITPRSKRPDGDSLKRVGAVDARGRPTWRPFQKRPPDNAELGNWFGNDQPKNIGLVCGAVSSNLVVLDFDSLDGYWLDFLEGVERLYGKCVYELTPVVKTSRGHQVYVKVKEMVRLEKLPGELEIRGEGHYVVAPPSIHPSGAVYRFIRPEGKDVLQIGSLADLGVRLLNKQKREMLAERPLRLLQQALKRARPGENRNETGFWLACQLRDRGIPQTEAKPVMLRYASKVAGGGGEPYTESEALSSLEQAFTRPARESWHALSPAQVTSVFNLTDMGNAQRLARGYGDILHYCYERKRWMVWTGHVWEWDWGNRVTELAKLTVRNIYREAADESDEKRRNEIASQAKSSESNHRINAMISLAESEPGIPIKATELDTNPWLFNCLNGTIDLKTGQLLPHSREDLLTTIVPLEYHPDAECPHWLTFLARVTGSNIELQGYLQRAVGYSLTGDTRTQVVFFLYGLGNNGKSTFITTIRKLMAGYGERVNTDLLMVKDKNTGGPKEALANLKGKRYVVASELEDGRRLAVSLIKDMTGGETIKADRKYEHEIEYQPTHKLWMVGNHKPGIPDTTLSIWRRMKLIPFTVTIPNNEIDVHLPSKLETELSGILAWAVKGCLSWQQYGLREPDVVATATASYRHEQDMLGDFIEDCCILEPLATIWKSDLKKEYHKWCQDNNIEAVKQRTFKARLIEKGIGEGRSNDGKNRLWRGIRVRTEDDPTDISDKTSGISYLTDKIVPDFPESPIREDSLGSSWKIQSVLSEMSENVSSDDMPDCPYPALRLRL